MATRSAFKHALHPGVKAMHLSVIAVISCLFQTTSPQLLVDTKSLEATQKMVLSLDLAFIYIHIHIHYVMCHFKGCHCSATHKSSCGKNMYIFTRLVNRTRSEDWSVSTATVEMQLMSNSCCWKLQPFHSSYMGSREYMNKDNMYFSGKEKNITIFSNYMLTHKTLYWILISKKCLDMWTVSDLFGGHCSFQSL